MPRAPHPTSPFALVLVAATLAGCGYTKEEYALQLDKLARTEAKLRTAEERAATAATELDSASERLTDLERRLRGGGLAVTDAGGLEGLTASLLERRKALEESQSRTREVALARTRVAGLERSLVAASVDATARLEGGRVVVTVAADALFEPGKETLRRGADALVDKLAAVLGVDATFAARDAQVACHTDDGAVKGPPLRDALGLSAMQARAVVARLTSDKGGKLPAGRWAATGHGASRPVATNDDAGRPKNRRCELSTSAFGEALAGLRAFEERE
jgi:flagellar motor protein MotB